jgi:V8-like Glu-specific endopeptidase
VTGANDTQLRYFTDTRGGSSGSPVFDDRWRVVALHCGAEMIDGINYQGRSTAWVNFGTQLQPILEHLGVAAEDAHREIGRSG